MKKIILITGLLLFTAVVFRDSPLWGQSLSKPRYISLAPSTTEILFALGLSENIVGVSTFCNYPPEAKDKPKIGNFSNPNIEKILSLKPDYIFCTGLEQAPVIAELKHLKLNVYVADPSGIEGLFDSISSIGKITARDKEAAGLIRKMREDIAQVAEKVRPIPQDKRVKVFIEIWDDPLMTCGKGSFVDELVTIAGGINVAHEVNRPYSNYSAEKVIKLNPGVIILAYMDKDAALKSIEARFGWKDIDAVKNKRVFNDINPDTLLRPGPRITEGLKELYKRLCG